MSDQDVLASLSAYPAIIVLVPAVAALVLTDRGWNMVTSMTRQGRTTLRPSDGTCAKYFWEDLADGPLHVCTSAQCHGQPHVKGRNCWDRTLSNPLNHWAPGAPGFNKKPECLPLRSEFLNVDADVVRSFILMASSNNYVPKRQRTDARDLDIASVAINQQIIKRTDKPNITVLHFRGTLKRRLSKEQMRRILDGGPPLVRDPWQQSIFSEADIARGGWIASIGLEGSWDNQTSFLPLYVDSVQYKDYRGGVFWRSIDRIIYMLKDIWVEAFSSTADDPKVREALKALQYMRERETESGSDNLFNVGSGTLALTSAQQRQIVDHFNGAPTLARSDYAQFRRDWQGLLDDVLVVAVRGTARCVSYVKNPGRELHFQLSQDMLDTSELYVRGC
ncbi:hypothetical protein FALBO_16313 [Fusarium albosuccineum]|uniref:Uncharacterized protein n=1 Tax=Fusarium albosuccineum TaxID=1237068 RepID=A0A8H4KJK5_9HYPO|nr:hypothetical protein FALBO_16313 [Fusarium albosuccineum]